MPSQKETYHCCTTWLALACHILNKAKQDHAWYDTGPPVHWHNLKTGGQQDAVVQGVLLGNSCFEISATCQL